MISTKLLINIMKYSKVTLKKKNITDFAAERNRLQSESKSEWMFFVDSDEKPTSKLKKEIGDLDADAYCAFFVKRKNYFLGSCVGEDKIIRLVKKGSGKWERIVHEVYHPNAGLKVGILKNYLIHNTAGNLHEYIARINNYSTLHALANNKEGKKPSTVKIIFFPLAKFAVVLAKSRNVVFSIMQSFHSFLAWSKLYVYQNKK